MTDFDAYKDFVWFNKVKQEVDKNKVKNYIKITYNCEFETPVVENNAFKGLMNKHGYANSKYDRYTKKGRDNYEIRIIGSYIFIYSVKESWTSNSEWSGANRGDSYDDGKQSDAYYLEKIK